jgi:hypothetical protein
MTDPLSLLRDADPAARVPAADEPPPRALLERIVATPPPSRRSPRRRLAMAVVAAAVAVAAVLGVLAPGERADLAARAYAAIAPGEGVLYTELHSELSTPGDPVERSVTRIWQRGDQSRWVRTTWRANEPWTVEYVQDDGVLHFRLPDGQIETIRGSDGRTQWNLLEYERTNFVDSFRARYAGRDLRDAGPATFDGRPARAYVASGPGRRETFYVDPRHGTPRGLVTVLPVREPGNPTGEVRFTDVLRRIERLPPTRENLAQLSAPWAEAQPRSTPSPTGQLTPVPPRPQ